MFTGIVRQLAEIIAVESGESVVRWQLKTDLKNLSDNIRNGDSVMHHGVCLTIVDFDLAEGIYTVEIIPETLQCTALGSLQTGDFVHIEPALRLQDGLDGHLVAGHVDQVATVRNVNQDNGEYRLQIKLPDAGKHLVAQKGSITINGVSLTVAAVVVDSFVVALIPETLERTMLGKLCAGDQVNLEYDLIARYLYRFTQVA